MPTNPEPRGPILVVGPGRCGTSTVAKLLHESVCYMGTGFRSDETAPDGLYEDLRIKHANELRNQEVISWVTWGLRIAFFTDAIKKEARAIGSPFYGWKDPRAADRIEGVVGIYPEAVYIRCRRDLDDILDSWVRCYGTERDMAADRVIMREDKLDEWLPQNRTLDVELDDLHDIQAVQDRIVRFIGEHAHAKDEEITEGQRSGDSRPEP